MARDITAIAKSIKLLANSSNQDTSEQTIVGEAALNPIDSIVAQSLAKLQYNELIYFSKLLKAIALVKPKNFFGVEEPIHLESWMRMFDKIFKALKCPEHMRVLSASFYLDGIADAWWSQNRDVLENLPDFGWETFKEELRNEFIPNRSQSNHLTGQMGMVCNENPSEDVVKERNQQGISNPMPSNQGERAGISATSNYPINTGNNDAGEEEDNATSINGNFSTHFIPVKTLLDSGATYSISTFL